MTTDLTRVRKLQVQHAGRGEMNVSVVVPVFNEGESVGPLPAALTEARRGTEYELVFVDDGSSDGSPAALEALVAADPHSRMVQPRRNYGEAAATDAGI